MHLLARHLGEVHGVCNETRLDKTQAILVENLSQFFPVQPVFIVHSLSFPTGLASIMKRLLTKYDNLFEVSFPYSMGWHGKRMHLILQSQMEGGGLGGKAMSLFPHKQEVLPLVLFPWRKIKRRQGKMLPSFFFLPYAQ